MPRTRDKNEIFPKKMSHWDWKRWQEFSDNARKLDDVLACCACQQRGLIHLCECEAIDEQNWLNDFLYVRRFAPPCVRAVNNRGYMVLHPSGFIMGPHTYKEWLSYAFDLFDYCHEVAERKISPDWSRVFFRHNDDFIGGHFKYFYPLTLIMINGLSGSANKHGAANDCSRGVDLYETLQPKDLNLNDTLRKKGHMITVPVPHVEYVSEIHKLNPNHIDAALIANKISARNHKFKKRIKMMRKANRNLDWNNAVHFLPKRKQNFKTWYPKIKNVPMWYDKKLRKWQLVFFYTEPEIEEEHAELFNKTIEKWLASGALIMLKPGEDVDLITPNVLANVPRLNGPPIAKGKKPRLCHDGGFEKNIEKYSFPCKLDDLRQVQKMMVKDDLMCVSDDQRGFHQQYLGKESRKLTAFSYRKQLFMYRVSPFGSPKIPAVFQRANMVPVNYSRSLGARVNLYLDDRITLDQPENVIDGIGLSAFITSCMSICAGGFISIEKSDFKPKNKQQFLGLLLDSKEGTISVPETKWKDFRDTILLFLKRGWCTFKELEQLRGKAVSFLLTNPMTKLFIRVMNSVIARLNKQKARAGTKIKLSSELRTELEEWIKLDHLQMSHQWINIFDIENPPHRITFTDASSFSAAAVIFDGNNEAWHFQRMFDEDQQKTPIFHKEALAVYWMLLEFEDELSNKRLFHFCDNESVCGAFNALGSKTELMNAPILAIYKKLHKMNSSLKMFWISTKYQIADEKSRQIEWNEEYLPFVFYHRLCRQQKFFPEVDAMATLANAKCDAYITLGHVEKIQY